MVYHLCTDDSQAHIHCPTSSVTAVVLVINKALGVFWRPEQQRIGLYILYMDNFPTILGRATLWHEEKEDKHGRRVDSATLPKS